MSEIEKLMISILNANGKTATADVVAVSQIEKAAKLLQDAGFENDAKLVLAALKEINNPTSSEETLFEV